jgi:hypothetical protein
MEWTRRSFLATGIVASPALVETITSAPREASSAGLNADEQNTLRAAMDEIIPAGDGMPSATQAGGFEYLQRVVQREADVAAQLRESLEELTETSGKLYNRSFADLSHEDRVAALATLEKSDPPRFNHLRDFVYESYYTQPQIWKLIGYEFYPTDHQGPHMKPFDESVLAEVIKKPKFYREA